ncbi:ArsR family transcriptional regulator [Mycolicibacterium llatzerense]|uniref:ArsR family transcriptional regulator n=2 Tax=Mycolicibacterium llatzerense TaxID=280871 RepID=A0A0D1LHP7_9MYCO|nr:ArsR family transcriptional regulator [Mycolicibacterium llatzerense]MCT7367140.1 ArsR family transcriptional regulator [Mycolicibacterium llatzerense]MCT7371715.1 ArsR family transcriptional regulator [Mycolicibacterium llatzerense]
MVMDSLDTAIIDVLREDGRIANVALAERVGLTPGPCLRRVQRLEADGVIVGYQAQISPAAANQSFEVLLDVEITDFDMKSIETFEAKMAAYPQVLELHRLFGSPDYLVRVAVADLPAYEQFLTSKVLAIPGIHRVSSRFPMKTIKSLRPL